jgi:hypothetical protein
MIPPWRIPSMLLGKAWWNKRIRRQTLILKGEPEDSHYNLDPHTGTLSRIGILSKFREQ